MIPMFEPMLSEFRQEAIITKRVLDRVPADKLSWRPHPKSMSLVKLALHVASIPGSLAKLTQLDEFDASKANFNPAAPTDVKEIHAAFDESIRAAEDCICNMTEQKAKGTGGCWSEGKRPSASLAPESCGPSC